MTDPRPAPDQNPVVARIERCRAGTEPLAIARLASGWLVLNELQPVRGYCQLLADPIAPSLNALGAAARATYLLDTVRIGDALLEITGAIRINYETWANLAPVLHTHIVPRHADEPDRARVLPVCLAYDPAAARRADPHADAALIEAIRTWFATNRPDP